MRPLKSPAASNHPGLCYPGNHRYSWKILLSGYAPLYAYESGRLDTSLPFEELKRRSHINAAAQAANDAVDFSQRIRADVPHGR